MSIHINDIKYPVDAVNYCIQCIEDNEHVAPASLWRTFAHAQDLADTYLNNLLPECVNTHLIESMRTSELVLRLLGWAIDVYACEPFELKDEQSGDVALATMWFNDFLSMGFDNWFGMPEDECLDLHWLTDSDRLTRV